MLRWREDLYARLRAHTTRCNGTPPQLVAFSGVRQWSQLFDPPLKKLGGFGLQPAGSLPSRWPYPADATEVWVLPSSSGRAVFSNEERLGPYAALGERLRRLPWPPDGSDDAADHATASNDD